VKRSSSLYGRTALGRETRRIRRAPEGVRNVTLNEAAYSLGQLIESDDLPLDEVREELAVAGLHAGLDPDEVEATVTSGLEAGRRSPRPPRGKRNRGR